jgi:hypothetical protein
MATVRSSPGSTRTRVHAAENDELLNEIKQRLSFSRALALRVFELFEQNEALTAENERLKSEVRARRKQADTWRRRFKKA